MHSGQLPKPRSIPQKEVLSCFDIQKNYTGCTFTLFFFFIKVQEPHRHHVRKKYSTLQPRGWWQIIRKWQSEPRKAESDGSIPFSHRIDFQLPLHCLYWEIIGKSWWRLSLLLMRMLFVTLFEVFWERLIGELSRWSQYQAEWGFSNQRVSSHSGTLWIIFAPSLGLLKGSGSNVWPFSTKETWLQWWAGCLPDSISFFHYNFLFPSTIFFFWYWTDCSNAF